MAGLAGCGTMGSRSVDPELAARVAERVASGHYIVDAEVMTPVRGRPRTLNYPWNVEVAGDTVRSYLPYVGEAYTPIMGRQTGLDFEAPIRDYSVVQGRRGSVEVSFWTQTDEDRYDYRITIWPGGGAYLRVGPDRKSAVMFDGRVRL
jgi:hypothetical protein